MIDFRKVQFLLSAHAIGQLPAPVYPDIAFAGRSNVGKSSLLNRLVDRSNLVKTSSKPGKTQSLNYFLVEESLYLVDLPGYGYAQVSQQTRQSWQGLITEYVTTRSTLACVVVIIDLRHELKQLDRELVDWLRYLDTPYLPVYTKADKLSRNQQMKNAAALDAGLTLTADDRIIFSSSTGQGLDSLRSRLSGFARSISVTPPGEGFIAPI
ncbi:ribosome biogenesis GTP-binding protein YsxC [Desulfobulbus propionicus DSM 2032]|jgi:GTP-binding protein|uniref:Probable GTP-binding protein EngB n=1 Tax=Desulfobulbus propionicus (strain ATCC 33891 / DSM 2032 / VKM B-1956 / 1pr3) TaxID=577650 RepID=A0A7U4DPE1_DESPD|nr:ribosome biogenesis GTP-binding protein YihA/YsxC [Desulfobulbus propionicus]ADW17964.1 ribosome biogenesis GTP-binding protein YsxC [Desulfobulbus propionicus DSM 2032]